MAGKVSDRAKILLVCLGVCVSVARGFAAEDIPPALQDALSRHGYELISLDATYWQKAIWAKTYPRQWSPLICPGDFNGDGLTDYALLVRESREGTLRLVVFQQDPQGGYRHFLLKDFVFEDRGIPVERVGSRLPVSLMCAAPGRKRYFEITRFQKGGSEKIKVKRKTLSLATDSFEFDVPTPTEWSLFVKGGAGAELIYFRGGAYQSVSLTPPPGD